MQDRMQHADLLLALSKADLGALENVRYSPTSFDASDSTLTAFPRERKAWHSAERAFAIFASRVVMARLPLFWQLHAPLHAACRAHTAAMYSNMLNNAPLGVAAMREARIDTIVSDVRAADMFAHEMHDGGIRETVSWIIVLSPHDDWKLPGMLRKKGLAAQEVHLFPGVVLLEQCESLIKTKKEALHLTDDFEWDLSGEKALISGSSPISLVRYELPFALAECGTCDCSRQLFTKAA